jgi:hypothetical protein
MGERKAERRLRQFDAAGPADRARNANRVVARLASRSPKGEPNRFAPREVLGKENTGAAHDFT